MPHHRRSNGKGDGMSQAELASTAAVMRRHGKTWETIAADLGLRNRQEAYRVVETAWKNDRVEISRNLEMLRDQEDERDDELREKLYALLEKDYLVVSHGAVVLHPETGHPLRDAEPILRIIDRLMKMGDRYALRHGLNQSDGLAGAIARRDDLESSAVVEAILAGFASVPNLSPEQRRIALEAAASALTEGRDPVVAGEVVRRTDEPS